MKNKPSKRYQDYVISDGRLVGEFEEMYKNSQEVPWHQDVTVNAIFSDITVLVLRHHEVKSMLDIGCGLGYVTSRIHKEVPTLEHVAGIDISETAIKRASQMFPDIRFQAGHPGECMRGEKFDVVVSKDVLWYVLEDVPGYLSEMAALSSHWIYIGQSFPEKRPFLGDDIFPDAASLIDYLGDFGRVEYSVVERDSRYQGREYAHVLLDINESGINRGR